MASSSYSTISSASVLDLKAELSKQQSEFDSARRTSKSTTGAIRNKAKPSIFSRSNKGLSARLNKDKLAFEANPADGKRDPAQVRAALEFKARLYDKIKRGKSGGLSNDQIDNLLVDFDEKSTDEGSDSDEDESATTPQRPIDGEADPFVEFTDEFGRTRQILRSEVPRGTALEPQESYNDSNVMYGDQESFPVYAPDPALLAARAAAYAATSSTTSHYDATLENRQRAAGAYNFSQNEETRAQQMAALTRDREETLAKREAGNKVLSERDKEKEVRRKKVEEKRKEVERKREEMKRSAGETQGKLAR